MILTKLLPAERLLHAGDVAFAGTFECAIDDPAFGGGQPSTSHCIVFSRTPVWIQHDGGVRYVADPTVVTFHTRGRAYRRWRIETHADRCDWIAFADDVLRDAVAWRNPQRADANDGTSFDRQFAPVAPDLYLAQRRLFDELARGRTDSLTVDEMAVHLLDGVLECRGTTGRRVRRATPQREFDAVQAVRERIAADPSHPTSLRALAASVGLSPFQLCRSFTRSLGTTLGAYRTRLRLLSALEPIAAGADLTTVALASGFNSHSHFTAAFRRAFGTVPSQYRRSTRE